MDVNGTLKQKIDCTTSILNKIQSLTDRKRIWVGFSGGVDSSVLLHQISKGMNLPFKLMGAIHINHGLSPKANEWAEHCQQFCDALQIPLKIISVKVPVLDGASLEDSARKARMKAFKSILSESSTLSDSSTLSESILSDDCLVLAHHEQDQAETILLRLFRGAGPLGIKGMKPKVRLGEIEIIRPFLEISKESILQYAKHHQLTWIEDESNQNIRFDRNFLRNEIIPKLNSRWPSVLKSINRAGRLCLETADALESLAAQDLEDMQGGSSLSVKASSVKALSVKALLELPTWRRYAVIRAWIQKLGYYPPSLDHIQRIDREILKAKGGAKPKLKVGNYWLKRLKDTFFLEIEPNTVSYI